MSAPPPSKLEAARKAPDRRKRTEVMAQVMREREAAYGACQSNHLRAAGFTEAEIWVYADDARALLSGRKTAACTSTSAGRREGAALAARARRIRSRIHAAPEVRHA